MMRIEPSALSRRPLKALRRALTPSGSTALRSSSKRSCAAVATLLTFWPPGPEERTNDSDSSLSGISIPAATCSDTADFLVGRLVEPRRSLHERAGQRARRARTEYALLLLRDGNRPTVGTENAPDRAVHIRAHVVDAVHGIGDPEADLEAHAVVLEADEARHRRRIAQDARMILGCLQEQLERNLRIVVVAHVHRELQAYALIRIAPVDERGGDQVLVRNQGVDAVAVPHHHVAAAQLLHPAEITGVRAGAGGEADDVAGLDGLVHQKDEAADEVARDRLQTEAQPQADGAGEYVERSNINAGGIDPQQHAEPQQQEVGELR